MASTPGGPSGYPQGYGPVKGAAAAAAASVGPYTPSDDDVGALRSKVEELAAENAELRRQLEAKDYNCHRIVMTGGPCAGKTTAMRVIRERLEDRNIRVFVAPEASSLLFTAGAQIKDLGSPESVLRFQVNLARVQLALEDRIGELADAKAPAVLLCDRGLLDGKAYCDAATWGHVMEEL